MNMPLSAAAKAAFREATLTAAAAVRKSGEMEVIATDIEVGRRLAEAIKMIDAMLIDARNLAKQSPYFAFAPLHFEGARQSLGMAYWRVTEADAHLARELEG
jgi:hypothetical protein